MGTGRVILIIARKNRSTRRKSCPSTTLSTTNPIWYGLEQNPGLCNGRQV